MKTKTLGSISALAFVATVVAANYVTTNYGMVPIGFGLMATAGTYLAGLAFVLRDAVHDTIGRRWSVLLVLAGAAVSYAISDPFIALASGLAFLVSEMVDLGVYLPLRKRGYIRAAIASNMAGAVVDTFLFLYVAGFGVTAQSVTGQIVGKAVATVLVVAGVIAVRSLGAVLRQPVRQ